MAVKWIGEAAHDLGISPLEAVELLALHQNYPMNGLLDEDRTLLLKRYLHERRGVEGSGVRPRTPTVAETQRTKAVESTAKTSPMIRDKSEEKTVIIPPPTPNG